jgi:hypothetical protein
MNIKIISGTCTDNSVKPKIYSLVFEVAFKIDQELFDKHNLSKKHFDLNQIEFVNLLNEIKPIES